MILEFDYLYLRRKIQLRVILDETPCISYTYTRARKAYTRIRREETAIDRRARSTAASNVSVQCNADIDLRARAPHEIVVTTIQ